MRTINDPTPKPLPVGTVVHDGLKILEVVEYDEYDDEQPFQYQLSDGDLVWLSDPLSFTTEGGGA